MYQAWIDVGGTFTDCYVSNFGEQLKRCKLLSTGLVPISCDALSDRSIRAPELIADPAGFWVGAHLRVMDDAGQEVARRRVIEFTDGVLACDEEIATLVDAGHRFEIDAGLESPVLAVRRLLGCSLNQALPPLQVRLGTTRRYQRAVDATGSSDCASDYVALRRSAIDRRSDAAESLRVGNSQAATVGSYCGRHT